MRLMQRRTDEQGSAVIIAIMLITITVVLSVAVVSRTSSGLSSSRHNQDYAGALTQADAGVSDALFRIDQIGTGATPTAFCVGWSTCSVAAVPGAPDVQYRVDVLDDNTVTIRSKGIDHGTPHAVEVKFARELEFPFGIFAKSAIQFHGTADGAGCTPTTPIVSCTGMYRVSSSNPPTVLAAGADVGTNGAIACNGSGSPAAHHATYPGGTTSGCPNTLPMSGSYNPLDPVSPCPAAAHVPPTPCIPAGNLAPFDCSDVPAVIPAGIYRCTTSLHFKRDTTIAGGGKVEIFVMPTGNALDVLFQDVTVNEGGNPLNLRINLAGAGKLDVGTGNNAGSITGILYLPSATATANGCKVDVRGALVINDYTCNGGPNSNLQYDERVTTLRQVNWQLRNFKEIPWRTVVIP